MGDSSQSRIKWSHKEILLSEESIDMECEWFLVATRDDGMDIVFETNRIELENGAAVQKFDCILLDPNRSTSVHLHQIRLDGLDDLVDVGQWKRVGLASKVRDQCTDDGTCQWKSQSEDGSRARSGIDPNAS